MDDDWSTSPSARRVQQHADDSRPAWLWSQDGQDLLWQNDVAELFLAKLKKHGLKLASPAIPIKGQVARSIRLGSPGRTSLARIQFLSGAKPTSATCATTPLTWRDGQSALLIVGVDAIAGEIIAAARALIEETAEQEPAAAEFAVAAAEATPTLAERESQSVDEAPAPLEEPFEDGLRAPEMATEQSASPTHRQDMPAQVESEATPEEPPVDEPEAGAVDDSAAMPEITASEIADYPADIVPVLRPEPVKALTDRSDAEIRSQMDAMGAIIAADEQAYQRELANWQDSEQDKFPPFHVRAVQHEPTVTEAPAEPVAEPTPEPEAEADAEKLPPTSPLRERPASRLSRLVEQLTADEALFTPLTAADDQLRHIDVEETEAESDIPDLRKLDGGAQHEAESDAALLAAEGPAVSAASAEPAASDEVMAPDEPNAPAEPLPEEPEAPAPVADVETVERVSRYNFDELSRILNDRVSEGAPRVQSVELTPPPQRTGSLINLGGETLVLNRLPLGILVFRDQQVLFANRAITEMVAYDSVENLRSAGLAAIFPAAGPNGQEAGPVNHLVQRDGTLVPVTARLQSISWQGRPALMLSASATEVRTGHEQAVKAFAETLAQLRGDGFIEATRTGVVSAITPRATALLEMTGLVEGKPLLSLVTPEDVPALRDFLERPARFAESERPYLFTRTPSGKAELVVFGQGQAGVVTGYFALVRPLGANAARITGPTEMDPALLARISRGVRQPLNTIIGFADLMRSEAFGPLRNERYETYAKDIGQAGQNIAALVDELDDFARLSDGRYQPELSSIAISALLESCVLRIREQASWARVIVRNAIAEDLPNVTADRSSLEQAVLNLLASAIDQSPTGGAVVISAKIGEDGSISVHVRDNSTNQVDLAERFVVFRDGDQREGNALAPVRSSVGLALTRSLLAVNGVSLAINPAGQHGMLFTLQIPAELVDEAVASDTAR
jgi:signal transduction histidine kinase